MLLIVRIAVANTDRQVYGRVREIRITLSFVFHVPHLTRQYAIDSAGIPHGKIAILKICHQVRDRTARIPARCTNIRRESEPQGLFWSCCPQMPAFVGVCRDGN